MKTIDEYRQEMKQWSDAELLDVHESMWKLFKEESGLVGAPAHRFLAIEYTLGERGYRMMENARKWVKDS